MTEPKAKAKPKAKPAKKSYFSDKELRCKHTGENGMDEEFVELLNKIRKECDFPLLITSGYRSKLHPIEQRKNLPGTHTTGKAVDIRVMGEKGIKLIQVALENGIKRIGVAQKGDVRFIHIDTCTIDDFDDRDTFPEYAIWSY
jgi:uncharacterized protein YcbK (DUF882 family)